MNSSKLRYRRQREKEKEREKGRGVGGGAKSFSMYMLIVFSPCVDSSSLTRWIETLSPPSPEQAIKVTYAMHSQRSFPRLDVFHRVTTSGPAHFSHLCGGRVSRSLTANRSGSRSGKRGARTVNRRRSSISPHPRILYESVRLCGSVSGDLSSGDPVRLTGR